MITVGGPVAPPALGITDAHTHVWIDHVPGADPAALVLTDAAVLERGLAAYRTAGGRSPVDCQPGGAGRDARRLVALSRSTGVQIVACTGFHLRRYYGPAAPLWRMTAEQAAAYMLGEIRDGLTETRDSEQSVRPGCIKIAAERSLTQSPAALFEAAAEAARATGYAVAGHTERGADAEAIVAYFGERGVAVGRLILCHVDKRPDVGLHRELARAGALLEYDTFFRPTYCPDEHVWPLLDSMLGDGLAGSVALATDMSELSTWQAIGPAALLDRIRRRLESAGVAAAVADALLGGNVAQRLALKGSTT